ncbi:MAG: PAS-domain containing protein [Alphaproteobacteria bacterium]|nr:PAS-domain containing protein [Alphaproteobacteria bacterium]
MTTTATMPPRRRVAVLAAAAAAVAGAVAAVVGDAMSASAGLLAAALLAAAAWRVHGTTDAAPVETLLRGAMDTLDTGIIMLGPDDRIVAWNDRLRAMAPDVAAVLRAGMTFEEMVAIAADVAVAKGGAATREAYVRARMAQHAHPGVEFEVARGGGRTIRVREDPIPGGGSIITYRDITAERAARDAAATSDRLARDAIDSIGEAILIFDADGRLVHWNGVAETMFPHAAGCLECGLEARAFIELHAHSALFAVAPSQRVEWIDGCARALGTPGFQASHALADGRVVRERVHARRGGGVVLVYQDVTAETAGAAELARAKAQAEASEARFRDFAEASSDWFWETGPDGRITWISSGIARFGFEPEALFDRRRPDLPYTVPSGQPGIARLAAATANREPFRDVEYEGVLRDGRRAIILVSGVPVFAPDGQFLGHRGTGRDVTAARGRDRELEHQSHLLRTIFTSMDEGISVFDSELRLVAWNDRFPELTGAGDLRAGMALRDVLIAQARGGEFGPCEPEAEADRRIRARWGAPALVSERRRPDGRTIEMRRHPVAGGGVVTIYVDITERKTRELHLAEAMDRERDLAAQQRRFVSIVAHEFRTPLTIIDGAAQRVARSGAQAGSDDVKTRVEKIRGAVSRMSLLIDTMLNSARLDAGTIEPIFASLDIVALLRTVVARQEGVAPGFDIVVESDNACVEIRADARLLDQVFTNLVANAIKYSGESRRIEIAVARTVSGVRVFVRDFGIGVPEDEVGRLFVRFFRASTAKALPGTGIGLNLVKELVQLHGGSVAVESRVGAGTCFAVDLPAMPAPGPANSAAA